MSFSVCLQWRHWTGRDWQGLAGGAMSLACYHARHTARHTARQVVRLTTYNISTICLTAGEGRLGSEGERGGALGGGGSLAYLQAVDDMLCVKVRILQPLLECINKQSHRICTMGACMSSQTGEPKGLFKGVISGGATGEGGGGCLVKACLARIAFQPWASAGLYSCKQGVTDAAYGPHMPKTKLHWRMDSVLLTHIS